MQNTTTTGKEIKPTLQLAYRGNYALVWTIYYLLLALQWELSPMYSYESRIIQCDLNIDRAYEYSISIY